MSIVRVTRDTVTDWAALCHALWPHASVNEMVAAFDRGEYKNEFLFELDGASIAFMSLSIRQDYVEGKPDGRPVGYLEGIYVQPAYRKRGIAGKLIQFAKEWCKENGCSMLASDCELSNEDSRGFHNKIGFQEVSVNVHFTMPL